MGNLRGIPGESWGNYGEPPGTPGGIQTASAGKSRDDHAPTTSSHRAPTGGNIPGTSRGILWGIPGNPGESLGYTRMYRGCTWDVPGGPGVPWMFPGCSKGGFTGGPWRYQKLAILSKFRHFIFQVVARGFDLPGTPESPGNPRCIPVQAPPLPPVSGYGVCGRDPPCGAGGARWGPGRGKWGAVGSGREFPVYRVGESRGSPMENPGEIPGESYGALLGNPGGILWGIPGESRGVLWSPMESYGESRGILWNTMGKSRGNPMEPYRRMPGWKYLFSFPHPPWMYRGEVEGVPGTTRDMRRIPRVIPGGGPE